MSGERANITIKKDATLAIKFSGVYKKQLFGRSGGGKLIHFLTFWGRFIQFSPLRRVKIEFLLYKNSIFKHIVNIFEYFVCLYLLFLNFIFELNITSFRKKCVGEDKLR